MIVILEKTTLLSSTKSPITYHIFCAVLFCYLFFYFFINESSFFGQLNNPLYKKVVFVLFNLAKNANILY
jgi:Na+/H+ antiporter NhaC